MNNYACESFINFLDDMMIENVATEGIKDVGRKIKEAYRKITVADIKGATTANNIDHLIELTKKGVTVIKLPKSVNAGLVEKEKMNREIKASNARFDTLGVMYSGILLTFICPASAAIPILIGTLGLSTAITVAECRRIGNLQSYSIYKINGTYYLILKGLSIAGAEDEDIHLKQY